MKTTPFVVLLAAAAAAPVLVAASSAEKRLEAAAETITDLMGEPDKSIPQDLLNKSECAVIVPGLKKGAFVFGGKYGRGFIACRREGGVGWGPPAAVRVEGGSFGFQIGGAETDLLMLIMNKSGSRKLLTSRFTLGADASVAAGPLGRDSSALTDAMMNAEILTWSRQRGAFAGISITGATLREDADANRALYGQPYQNKDILNGSVDAPKAASRLLGLLNKYSSRK